MFFSYLPLGVSSMIHSTTESSNLEMYAKYAIQNTFVICLRPYMTLLFLVRVKNFHHFKCKLHVSLSIFLLSIKILYSCISYSWRDFNFRVVTCFLWMGQAMISLKENNVYQHIVSLLALIWEQQLSLYKL